MTIGEEGDINAFKVYILIDEMIRIYWFFLETKNNQGANL